MLEKNKIQTAIGTCRALLSELEERSERGFESSFGTVHDRLSVAIGKLPYVHTLELAGPSSSAATLTLATKAATSAAVKTVASNLSFEDARKLRRLGLDPRYVGLKDEGDLFDLKHASKGGK